MFGRLVRGLKPPALKPRVYETIVLRIIRRRPLKDGAAGRRVEVFFDDPEVVDAAVGAERSERLALHEFVGVEERTQIGGADRHGAGHAGEQGRIR